MAIQRKTPCFAIAGEDEDPKTCSLPPGAEKIHPPRREVCQGGMLKDRPRAEAGLIHVSSTSGLENVLQKIHPKSRAKVIQNLAMPQIAGGFSKLKMLNSCFLIAS